MKTHKLGVGQFVELVEQCCADVEAMGFNCVEATKNFFRVIGNCLNCNHHCDNHLIFVFNNDNNNNNNNNINNNNNEHILLITTLTIKIL